MMVRAEALAASAAIAAVAYYMHVAYNRRTRLEAHKLYLNAAVEVIRILLVERHAGAASARPHMRPRAAAAQ